MANGTWWVATALVAVLSGAGLAHAEDDGGRYSIMKPEPGSSSRAAKPPPNPEPWLAPKYQSPRGTREHVRIPRTQPAPEPPARKVPPDLHVPETGRTLPNLPSATARGGRETSQDRALRCAHQAGVYGPAAGDRSTYINSCVNQ